MQLSLRTASVKMQRSEQERTESPIASYWLGACPMKLVQ